MAIPASAQPTQGIGVAELPGPLPTPGLPLLSPPGSNDFSSWQSLSPRLAADGYCVFALDYGRRGTIPIEKSAGQLGDFVDRVLAATAAPVSLVGHSQGGMMPRYSLRFLGGAAKVDELIGLAASNHGTQTPLAPVVGPLCRACAQQAAGSPFLTNLNAGREVEPGVDYTNVVTRYDEVVVPFRSGYLSGPASQVTNITLQAKCPFDVTDHLLIIYDPVALQWVEDALRRDGPADPAFRPACR